ncbi:hypothetical protein [Halomonas sp. PBN3]|nr:hypothetical protein [Halomonas sp. PBN3]
MADTRERLATLGWRLACPATVWDLDRPEDLERWRRGPAPSGAKRQRP